MITHNDLIELSKLFKRGFTFNIRNNELIQAPFIHGSYIVALKTILTIDKNKSDNNIIINGKIPVSGLIGGWLDKTTNKYYIEVCDAHFILSDAMHQAKIWNQKYIYDFYKEELIKVE